jgi:hypothetical protein
VPSGHAEALGALLDRLVGELEGGLRVMQHAARERHEQAREMLELPQPAPIASQRLDLEMVANVEQPGNDDAPLSTPTLVQG